MEADDTVQTLPALYARGCVISTERIDRREWLTRLHRTLDPEVVSIQRARRRQLSMSPSGRHLVPETEIPRAARESGVCIVLTGSPPNLKIPLIVRGADDGPHSGQVAFPGGAREDQDTTIEETAVRECEEEIGLPRDYHDVVGTLYPLYLHVSNYRVVPVVTRAGNDDVWDALRPQPGEVARILRAHLGALFASRGSTVMRYHGADHTVPCFTVHGETVWGATAMILAELEGALVSSGAL